MPSEHSVEGDGSPRLDRRQFARQAAAWTGITALGWTPRARGQSPKPNESKVVAPIRVRVWCEGTAPRAIYPHDVDGALGDDLRQRKGFAVTRGRLGEADAGLADKDLDATDVLVWWGRLRHDDVPEGRAKAVVERVKAGRLGLVALHASHASKPFRSLLDAPCAPKSWRDDGRPEHVAIRSPGHPIARGLAPFTIPKTAMYAEPFEVPEPEAVVFVSSWDQGETFRSGLTWTVGLGRVAYFRPGHDGFPVLFHPSVRQVIANSARWAGRGGDEA
jgi:trehalose utilization protein